MTAEIVDWPVVALILAGAVAGGIVNGLTGFGTALTGLPLWLQAVEPLIAAQLASACSVLGHLTTLPEIWRAAAWRRLAPMLIAGLLGVPIGTWLLPLISLATFKVTVGVTLIAYCSVMLLASAVYATLTGWAKEQRRVFFQTFNLLVLSAMLAASAVQGLVGRGLLLALGVAVPATLVGSWLGVAIYRRLDDRRFDRIVLIVLLLSGVGLVWFSR
jgi:uncharacterized membrane protein YfcA